MEYQAIETVNLYNISAETNVLGSLFLEPELIKDCTLKPEHFSPGRHFNIFYTLKDLDAKGLPIDFVSVVERVGNKRVEKLGGVSYLSDLAGSVASKANFNYHCALIIEYYQRRQAINVAEAIKQAAIEGDALEAIQSGVTDLMAIEDAGTDEDDGDIKEALVDVYEDLESATGEITGVVTGFTELDRMTGGLQPEDLIIIGARPSVGKTAFSNNIALNASKSPANEKGDVVAIFSLEMSKKQLLKRMAATIGHVDQQRMKSAAKSFTGSDWTGINMAMGHISKSDIKIFDKPGVDVNYIWSKARKLKRQFEGRRILIIIDYLQLIVGSKKHGGNRQAEIGEISRMLKTMARELKITVMALSQLSRGVEQRQDKRPMMSDLRESGQIEQDADIIGFLYRDDYYDKQSENKNIVEVILAKHRNGPVGNVQLAFVKEYGKFVNIEHRRE